MSTSEDPRVSEAELVMDDDDSDDDGMPPIDLEASKRRCLGVYLGLEQDQIWVDIKGVAHQIEQMTVGYKSNVLAFQRRRASFLHQAYQFGALFALDLPSGYRPVAGERDGEPVYSGPVMTRGEFLGLGDGGNMDAGFDGWLESVETMDPTEWLESTPLMKRLIDDVIHSRGGDDG